MGKTIAPKLLIAIVTAEERPSNYNPGFHCQKGYSHSKGDGFFLNRDPLAKPRDIRKNLTGEFPSRFA